MQAFNNSRVGDKVMCNGYPGTVTRTKHSDGSAWMGGVENGVEWGMVEIRLPGGVACVSDCAPDVVQVDAPS